jgi:hypothetical protein
MGPQLFHADRRTDRLTDRQTDRHTDRHNEAVAFRDFAKAPKNVSYNIS